MEDFFYEDIKYVISKYLKLNDAKNFLSLNKNFRKQFVLIYDISIVNYSNLYNNFILKGISMENIRHIYFNNSFNQQLDKLFFNRRSQTLKIIMISKNYKYKEKINKYLPKDCKIEFY